MKEDKYEQVGYRESAMENMNMFLVGISKIYFYL